MEELKSIFKHPEILSALGEEGVKAVVMRALLSHYSFRNSQRIFGMILCVPYFVLCYISTANPKNDVKDWVWYGCAICLFTGLAFFFPKQSEPLFNLFMKRLGVNVPSDKEDADNTPTSTNQTN